MRPIPQEWHEPPWTAPLDADALIRLIPADATMTGVFLAGVADLGRQRGVRLTKARDRYTPFQSYPLREHCELMLELSRVGFSKVPLREALRKLGRGAPNVLLRSTVGRVVLGSVEGPLDVLRAMAKSYVLHMRPCTLEVLDAGPGRAIVRLSQVHNFLDSHNVGVFEGCLRYADVKGDVRIHSYGRETADLLCTWQ
jgi:uncharacterized protein (TIGR02265 family)